MNAQIIETTDANELADLYTNGDLNALGVKDGMGVYEANGRVFVVKPNQEKSRLYAKVWNGSTLEYAAGAIYNIHPCHKVSAQRGEELSLQIGACCVCARTLTASDSVKRGIGPVCRKYFR